MWLRFAASVPKDPEAPDANEDAFAYSNTRGVYALSDGASESFAPQLWSRMLVDRFVADPLLGPSWLEPAITGYAATFDRASLSWSKQASFDRGSYATLLGIVAGAGPRTVHVTAVGDSFAALVEGGEVAATFPYCHPDEFRARPLLLSTQDTANGRQLARDPRTVRSVIWSLSRRRKTLLLCMTDALGRWFLESLRAQRSPATVLAALHSRTAFDAFVARERAAGRLRRDDTTLLVLG